MLKRFVNSICLYIITIWFFMLPCNTPLFAFDDESNEDLLQVDDLGKLSLEQLMNIEITSVSKRPERLQDASAAVYVITADDIRRSGLTRIPELLRMVPGIQVSRIDANKWMVSSRGFSDRFVGKLLVLMDGRSIYTPLFSGVFWDVQDTMIEDIERIEVIRGPGATMWGANAVNGIINIITKSSQNTQGGLVSVTGGNIEKIGAFRYGTDLGHSGKLRAYLKYSSHDDFDFANGSKAADGWRQSRMGFRLDKNLSLNESLTVQGDIYDHSGSQTIVKSTLTPPYYQPEKDNYNASGSNIIARWNRTQNSGSNSSLQVYYDRTKRHDSQVIETRDTFDLDYQRNSASEKNDFIWGLGYRLTKDKIINRPDIATFKFYPTKESLQYFNVFAQNTTAVRPERFHLTIGTKLEYNEITNLEIQPTIRAIYTPSKTEAIWGAISRAVRVPSRGELSTRMSLAAFPTEFGYVGTADVQGNPKMVSEILYAYELGYRLQPKNNYSFDLAAFYNDYHNFRSLEPTGYFIDPVPDIHLVFPYLISNKVDARTYGAEIAANWNVRDWWKLAGSCSLLQIEVVPKPDSLDTTMVGYERNSPAFQFNLCSNMDFGSNWEFNTMLYYMSAIKSPNMPPAPSPDISSHLRLDFRLGWKPRENSSFEICLQNVLKNRHTEFGQTFGEQPTAITRSIYGRYVYNF